MIKINTIAGDGIGKEVMEAGLAILDSFDLNFDFVESEAGYDCFKKNGTALPDETLKKAKKSKATLFGAITSTPSEKSPIVTLRKELNVFANLRPVKSYDGVDSLFKNVDILIVRENTEGFYSQVETMNGENEAIANRIITKEASERIAKFGFEIAAKTGKKTVTCVHKDDILKKTDAVFKEAFYRLAEDYSKKYPNIIANDYYINQMALSLVKKPHEFDVIVASNLFGDILSDEGAGLVGGLGLSPSASIGKKHGLFEPVHGSAPDIAGKQIANPIAMILSIAMMLDFLNEDYYSKNIKLAVENVLKRGNSLTPDLRGSSKTMDLAMAVKEELSKLI